MEDPKTWNIDSTWTLFLDRDGVVNKRLIGDYVKNIDEFEFNEGALDAIKTFAGVFDKIMLVTNQQGIGKGLMTDDDLTIVHAHMLGEINKSGGRLDSIYYCPELAQDNPRCRKPEIGMAEQAKEDFKDIDFAKSIMIGDSISDMGFGRNAGMKNIFIASEVPEGEESQIDVCYESLAAFAAALS